MDSRDLAALRRSPWEKIDQKRMIGTIWLDLGYDRGDDEGGEQLVEVPLKFDVCPLCDGRGSHVNPSIDAHGLSAEDFAEDPDFADDYFRGAYDQPCNECGGQRVVPVPDPERVDAKLMTKIQAAEQAACDYASECYHERMMGY